MIMIFLKNQNLQKQKNQSEKKKKVPTHKNAIILRNGSKKFLNIFEIRIFRKGKQGKGLTNILDCVDRITRGAKVSDRKQLKVLSPKQMVQRLPIALKAGNKSENLLNEIRQIIYSLYRSKKIAEKYTII